MGLNFNSAGIVKGFFGGNAYLAIIFLLFICLFLFKSGMGFIPSYKNELANARESGLEASNMIHYELKGYNTISSKFNQAFSAEKRERFGDKETLVYVYEEFEGLLDDKLEDEIDDYIDEDEDSLEKETIKAALLAKIDTACRGLGDDFLLKKITPRIPSTTTIKPETIDQAIKYAQQYALDDYETPDEIDKIPAEIAEQMGEFGSINKNLTESSAALLSLHKTVENTARKSYDTLNNNHQLKTSIKKLKQGLAKQKEKLSDLTDPDSITAQQKIITGIEINISDKKSKIRPIDTDEAILPIYSALEGHSQIILELKAVIPDNTEKLKNIEYQSPEAEKYAASIHQLVPEYLEILDEQMASITKWKHDKKVGFLTATKAFFFGLDWKAGSTRQSLYGLIPLLTGSLLISVVAMFFAIPLAIGSAIYVNQFASKREAWILKPAIEFIQAIPSVVLGLFGILVVGGMLKTLSASSLLSWIPGFPINDRLNVLLAGILLAFMASPTIFTLAEDALNNVPKAFKEASLAMGATRLQTSIKVILPAALSGIIAAIMLGFGRVIGETMVVLLVAGNKAKIPNFSEGIGVLGQPVHTMTGIIAQEYGEASHGSTIYQSLFMVGLVLFTISLVINTVCQRILARQHR